MSTHTLHIIRSEQALEKALSACKNFSQKESIILIEAGVYLSSKIHSLDCACYLLSEDLKARAIKLAKEGKSKEVDYAGFVELTENHQQTITW